MATELDQTYCGWPHQELLGQEDSQSQDAAIAQMLDEGSISFGRYAVETLAWEKRSVFTHNRCQEELEKLKAPGLVAQKKAYFEAYYKKIRALKALQVHEQSEVVVNYGGDDNGSCQNGELEDEGFEHETHRNGVLNVATASLKEHAAEVAPEMESSDVFHCRHSDPKSIMTCHDFSTRTIGGDINSTNAHLNNGMIQEPAGSCTDCSKTSFKDIHTDKNPVDGLAPESSISYENLQGADIEYTELAKNCGDAHGIGFMSKESTLLDSPRRIEEIELLKSLCSDDDDDCNMKETHHDQCSISGGTCSELNGADSRMLKPNISELPPVDSHIIAKVTHKQVEHSSTARLKESVSSAKKTMKMEHRTKPVAVKASQGPKYLHHKTIVAKEKNVGVSNTVSHRQPSKTTSTSDLSYRPHKVHPRSMIGKEGNNTHLSQVTCTLPRENKNVSISSSRPLKVSHSSIATSSPFSVATQRRPTTSGGIRESRSQISHSKSLNGSIQASQSQQLSKQSTSMRRQHVANGVKTASLGKKSHHGEILKTEAVLNYQTAVSRARDRLVQRPEARSLNLPAVSKYSLPSRAGPEIKGERPKEGKTNARSKLLEGTSKPAAAPPPRTNKSNLRKLQQVSSKTVGVLLDGKKSSWGHRQEIKPWR